MEEKIESGKNPYDMYASGIINKNTKIFLKMFLGIEVNEIKKKDPIIKKDQEVRLDHIYKAKIGNKYCIINLEDQLTDNSKLESRQSLYYGLLDSHLNEEGKFSIISIFTIFIPSKNFKEKCRKICFYDKETNSIYREDELLIKSINNIDPKIIFENNLDSFLPFVPFMKEMEDETKHKDLYKEVFLRFNNIDDIEESRHIKKYFLLFYKRKFGNFNTIKELNNNMTTKELIKKFDFEDVIEELKDEWVEENKKGWLEDGENKKAITIAKSLKNEGINFEFIMKHTGLSIDEIEKL